MKIALIIGIIVSGVLAFHVLKFLWFIVKFIFKRNTK